MLDDLKMIHERDSKDTLGTAGKLWQQLKHDFTNEPPLLFKEDIQHIVFAGVGSSTLAAEISNSWPGYSVPFEVCQNYQAPQYVNNHTLFITCDYSGDSEEVISSLRWAEDNHANIVVIASGGELLEHARDKKYSLIVLPPGLAAAQSVLYMLMALYNVIESAGLSNDLVDKAVDCAEWIRDAQAVWLPTTATSQNLAKQIAQELAGKSVVVYSGPLLYPSAHKWKSSINEYAKQVAWYGQYPEFSYGELAGWTKQPVTKPYAIVDIRSNLEQSRIQKQFEASERLLSGLRPSPIVVHAAGESLIAQILHTYVLGEFVAIYLALLAGNDPSSDDVFTKFKKELA